MDDKKILGGFGVLIAVLFGVAVVRGFSDDGSEIGRMIADELSPVADAVGMLETRVSDGEAAVADQVAALEAAFDARVADMKDGFDAQMEELRAAMADLSDRAGDAVSQADMNEIRAELAALAESARQTVSDADESGPEDPELAEAEAVPGDPAEGLKPGQTALFADGAMRVFVSRIDAADGRARVSLNGQTRMMRAGVGRTVASDSGLCRVFLQEVTDDAGAVLTARCDAEMGPPEGVATGRTTTLADSALRVFVSRVTEDTARLSVNGQTVVLEAGDRDVIQAGELTCRLLLEQVDRGSAEVSAVCTDAVSRSTEIGAGQSAILGDGAARVFVSRVGEGRVRFALNGQDLQTAGPGDSLELDSDCDLDVEAVSRNAARFSHACY